MIGDLSTHRHKYPHQSITTACRRVDETVISPADITGITTLFMEKLNE